MKVVTQPFRSRALRALAAGALVAVQAQLLWLGEFHREDEAPVSRGPAVVVREASTPPGSSSARPLCVACHISRQSVARPATGPQAEPPVAAVHFRPDFAPRTFDRFLLAFLPARAPPVL